MSSLPPPVSLIIVSRHRTAALLRAITGVAQMDHPAFEVIVIADPAAVDALRATGLPFKLAEFDEANISAARNLGLSLAAAPVVAFLDDDAVPEPTWLSRLTAPFHDPRVTQAGGFVRDRSGFGWQWRALRVDMRGFDHPFDPGPGVSLHSAEAGRTLRTQGTNCAFRRDGLLAIGGFDPAFRFYLDETDVNLRLAARGGLSALVPDAVVHHGLAASARRRSDRVPTDLFEIGASVAAFLRRHAPDDAQALTDHEADQHARLIRHMVAGGLEPRDVARLIAGFRAGLAEGQRRPLLPASPMPADPPAFLRLPGTGPRPGLVLGRNVLAGPISGPAKARQLRDRAAEAVAAGQIVTLFRLARGFHPQVQQFHPGGWWEISGGRFGRADRNAALPRLAPASTRQQATIDHISAVRPVK